VFKIKKHAAVFIAAFSLALSAGLLSCATTQREIDALNDPNRLDNVARGDPLNTARAREYVLAVRSDPAGRELKAYERRAYSSQTRKTIFIKHGFYRVVRKLQFPNNFR